MAGSVGGIEFNVGINAAGAQKGAQAVVAAFKEIENATKKLVSQVANIDPFTGAPTPPGGGGGGGGNNRIFKKTLEERRKLQEDAKSHTLATESSMGAAVQNRLTATIEGIKRAQAVSREAADESKKAAKAAMDDISSIGSTAASIAGAITAVIGVSFIKDVTLLAGRVEVLGTVLDNVGTLAGKNQAELGILEDATKKLGITTRQAREGLVKLAQSELDLANATKLARIAQDSAVIAGVNSSEAFNRLTIAIARGDSRLLRNLGIVVNLAQVYQDFAQSVGRTVNTLTPLEKRQLILNEVFKKGVLIQGTYEASLQDVFKRYQSLDRFVEEAKVNIGNNFLPLFELLVDSATAFAKALGSESEGGGEKGGAVARMAVFATTTAALIPVMLKLRTAIVAVNTVGIGPLLTSINPITIAIIALSVAIGYLVSDMFELEAAAKRAAIAAEEAGNKAAEAVQKRGTAAGGASAIKDILSAPGTEKGGRTQDQVDRIYERIAEIRAILPETGERLKKVFKESGASSAQFAEELANVEQSFQGDIDKLPERLVKQEQLVQSLARSYGRVFGGTLDSNLKKINDSIAAYGSLDKVIAEFESQVLSLAGQAGAGADEFLADVMPDRRAFEGTKAEARERRIAATEEIESIRARGQAYKELAGQVRGAQEALRDKEFANLDQLAKNTEEAANQAEEQLSQIATERRKIFKDTNIEILDDYQQFLSKQKSITLLNEQQINDLVENERQRGLSRALKQRQDADAADPTKAAENLKIYDDKLIEVERSADRLDKTLRDQLNKSIEGFAANLDLANFRLDEEAKKIQDLEEEVALLEKGLDIDTTRALKRFHKELEVASRTALEAQNRISSLTSELETLSKNDPKRLRIVEQIKLAEDVLGQTVYKQQVLERKLVIETFELRRQKLRQLHSEEERLLERIADLRGTTALKSLQSVEKLAKAQKDARIEVDKFLQDQKLSRIDPGGNLKKFIEDMEKWRKNIVQARPDQLNLIKKIFPEAERQALKELNRGFEEIDRRTRRFSEDFEERVGEINLQANEIFKSKLEQSGSFERAAAASEKFRTRSLEDLELERQRNEEAIKANKEAKIAVQVKGKNSALDVSLRSQNQKTKSTLETQDKLLQEEAKLGLSEVAVEEQLIKLKDRQIAQAQEELGINQRNLETYQNIDKQINATLEKSSRQVTEFGVQRNPAATLKGVEEPKVQQFSPEEIRRQNLQKGQDALQQISGPVVAKQLKATADAEEEYIKKAREAFEVVAEHSSKQETRFREEARAFEQAFTKFRTLAGKK